jgi:hypothetical protein
MVNVICTDGNFIDSHVHEPLDRLAQNELDIFQTYDELADIQIPTDPQKFYEDFGLFEHPLTRKPVKKLTTYQYNTWKDAFNYRYRLVVKSQKVGITTSTLLEDFQKAVLPIEHPLSCMGKEILIIAQTADMAKEHLYTLRKMVLNSKKYAPFLISKASSLVLRDEVTKATVMYVKNPNNVHKPTRIIALSPSERSVWSWKEVKHIHMSDVAVNQSVDDSGLFGASFSRLANTNGSMIIESPPRGQRGQIWEIYQASKLKGDEEHETAKFKVREISAESAVDNGLMTQEFLNQERVRLGVLYAQYYECAFLNPYTSWYDENRFMLSDDLANKVGR